ncbi:ATP-grasp domain-containing protein [Hippea sp. KM1]|uniref:ATP-grasp domain-containing protein n=1 Tax=Hippea sp. KM1 TaxID=944481 RepID=UPI00046CE1CB|nr:ATP-grasp domain-containing protein [Hippea sp. KM1]
MKEINVLITSAGRRVSLVRNFQKYAKVYTCDMNPEMSAACQVSDGYFRVPKVNDKNYIEILLDYCLKNNINIVIPTIDPELIILSKAKTDFKKNNILIAISSLNICEMFYSKRKTEYFFKKIKLKTPRVIDNLKDATYPLFAKLENSSSSVGATKVESYEEAIILKKKNPLYVFQEYIEGEEYTVDVFVNREGKVISIVPRLRIEVRSGEVSKGKTVKDAHIIGQIKKLFKHLNGVYGAITVQLFKKEGELFFIEINPRFGGGYPLSYLAGSDFAKYLIKDYLGENLEYSENWKNNLIMLRYDAEVLVDGGGIRS